MSVEKWNISKLRFLGSFTFSIKKGAVEKPLFFKL